MPGVPGYDSGNAQFSTSGGARNVVAGMNPLTPGGMSPKGVHMPTMAWAILFIVAAFLIYKYALKGKV